MSDKHQKFDTDELISLYLDGQASERQKTELKRLIQHDPALAERIKAIHRQKKVLNALPVETAPASLLEDVRSAMERNLILENPAAQPHSRLAGSHLAVKRLLAAAAMVLVPMGVLALVVFHIIKPPADGPGPYIRTDERIAEAPAAVPAETDAVVESMPFKGVLVLRTDQYMTVSGRVKEAIEAQQLLGQAFPQRTADVTRFQVTASPKDVAELVDALAPVRAECRAVLLQVPGSEAAQEPVEIADIQDDQLRMLLYEDSREIFNRRVMRYAAANQQLDPLFEDRPALQPDGYPQPSIPTLAGSYELVDRTVELTIQIERAE